jgi:hypothetical protein
MQKYVPPSKSDADLTENGACVAENLIKESENPITLVGFCDLFILWLQCMIHGSSAKIVYSHAFMALSHNILTH